MESLDDLLLRLREDRGLFLTGEKATCQGAVLPILGRLGWDRDNIREVVPEFPVGNGRVDYCLKVSGKNVVFIEVKRISEELEKHREQLLDYAFRDGVEIAVLTNGLLWWLYLPLLQGSWEERKFFTIDIQQQEIPEAAGHFRDFLARESVASRAAIERAQAVHASTEKARIISQTIPTAWKQLCQEPDDLLLELLADRVESLCGHRPDQERLADFVAAPNRVRDVQEVSPKTSAPAGIRRDQSVGLAPDGPYTGTKPRAYVFMAERNNVSTYKEVLMGLCTTLYKAHRANFEDRVLALRGRKREYFSRDFKGMKSPKEIPGSGIYVETNLSANMIMDQCSELLRLFGHSRDELRVEREAS